MPGDQVTLESSGAIKAVKRNYLAEAEEALRRNDPDAALKSLDAALAENSENPGAHFWRGRLLAGKNEWDKALADHAPGPSRRNVRGADEH